MENKAYPVIGKVTAIPKTDICVNQNNRLYLGLSRNFLGIKLATKKV